MTSNDDEKQTTNNANNKESGFECNICLDNARDAVLSRCGHLFCWPCIHQWLEVRADQPTCPVCKSAISREQLIPIYGRNSPRTDPREKIPPRPAGTREESQQNRFGFGEGFHFQMSFGIGAFPFGLFQTTYATNNVDHSSNTTSTGPMNGDQHEFLSHILLGLAIVVMLFVLFS